MRDSCLMLPAYTADQAFVLQNVTYMQTNSLPMLSMYTVLIQYSQILVFKFQQMCL